MAVRETEKYLPAGGAKGLGQCALQGRYALISYLSSPIPHGLEIEYVLVATEGAPATGYNWTFEEVPSGTEPPNVVKDAVARCTPEHIGTLRVAVEIVGSGSPPVRLNLNQEIIEPRGHLFTLMDELQAATIGDSEVLLELVHAFKPYILEAMKEPANGKLPMAFLAAVTYAEANRVGAKARREEMEKAERQLNAGTPVTCDDLYVRAMGVCQMLPETIAM